jgi:hypothetical protein
MDGPYFSIYPYSVSENLYTVTSVRHGVVWKGKDMQEVTPLSFTEEEEKRRRTIIEAEVAAILPEFPTCATYHSHFYSWKTKPITEEDDRSLRFRVQGRTISLYGGKITGIFEAARRVLRTII